MEIDQHIAAALGFPKLKYTLVERERRWLCREVPIARIIQTVTITDLYVTGARLRLREERPLNGDAPALRLTRKADVSTHIRLISSIYLQEEEFGLLSTTLTGIRIIKRRHRLTPIDCITIAVDEFQGNLSGLLLAEAEFETDEQLSNFPQPDFAIQDVTDDPRFTGGNLAKDGLPSTRP